MARLSRQRRRSMRVAVTGPVTLAGRRRPAFVAQAVDVSATGMAVYVEDVARLGEYLTIAFMLIESGDPIHAYGAVIRQVHRGRGYLWGILFEEIDGQARTALTRFVLRQKQQEQLDPDVQGHVDALPLRKRPETAA